MPTKATQPQIRFASNPDRKFAVIAAVATMHKPTLRDLEHATGIPGVSLRRLIVEIRKEFDMDLLFVREKSDAERKIIGKQGYYTIQTWGILNKQEFLAKYVKPQRGKAQRQG